MRETLERPGMVRYIVVLLVGLPVALIVSGMHPDRQGAGFVPFILTLAAALAVVWLLGVLIERWWIGRRL
jgi:hypothetical protein